ncbi:MAG: type II secretion system protein N [Pseudomonadota bacterium]|nr:type II secretion system protein N [Pseudomonadota bacterium]
MLATDRRIPLLLAAATAISMVALTVWQGYRFWNQEMAAGGPVSQATAQVETGPGQAVVPNIDFNSLSIFGTASGTAEAADINTENLPETNLRLTLRGVLAADGEFPGSALVEDDSRNTEAYLVGDTLPGDARLRTVLANRVIIERAGKLENLYFPESEDRTGFDIGLPEATEPETQEASADAGQPQNGANAAASDQRREEIRQRLEQLRQRLQNGN